MAHFTKKNENILVKWTMSHPAFCWGIHKFLVERIELLDLLKKTTNYNWQLIINNEDFVTAHLSMCGPPKLKG